MFQLVFKGECAPGTDAKTARSNAKALFKASVEQLDRMFSGQPVVIRNKLEQVQAEKYQAVLQKHGMVAYVQPMPGTPAQTPSAEPASKPAVAPARNSESPAAAGADPAPQPPKSSPETTKTGRAPEVEPGDRLRVAGEQVDDILAGSRLTLDPVGITLSEAEEAEPPMFEHLDEWSLAPAGSDLGVERDLPPPPVPDVSHLSLADDDDNKS